MLQQTRVETAIPYYVRFLERFPNPRSLAAADATEVLRVWSGLGYYHRARRLQSAARDLCERGAEIPHSAAELQRLPGIGSYTAAAIASIAFGEPIAVLDGNVARVLARVSAEAQPIERAAARARLLAIAASWLDRRRPGDSNQALMELGATVCLPVRPECGRCPLEADCQAHAQNVVADYPRRSPKLPTRRVAQIAAIVERDGRLLLFRRADDATQLAGLWELPLVEERTARGAEQALAAKYGGVWGLGAKLGVVRHAITVRTFTIAVLRSTLSTSRDEIAEGCGENQAGWFAAVGAGALPLSGAARKILSRLAP